jgi:hypothetical protein
LILISLDPFFVELLVPSSTIVVVLIGTWL